MYPSGFEFDDANDRLVVADTGGDRILFYSLAGTKLGRVRLLRHRRRPVRHAA